QPLPCRCRLAAAASEMPRLCPAYRASQSAGCCIPSWHIRCIDGSRGGNKRLSARTVMSDSIDRLFDLHQSALGARAYRSQVLASNIANADTPGFQARDVDFKAALAQALGGTNPAAPAPVAMVRTSTRHMGVGG